MPDRASTTISQTATIQKVRSEGGFSITGLALAMEGVKSKAKIRETGTSAGFGGDKGDNLLTVNARFFLHS